MSAEWSPWFHRLRYWQGQVVRSLDLNDQVQFDTFLRAWHTRAMHDAYGIRRGLQVTLDDSRAAVSVSPGLAFDARGQALMLLDETSVRIPDQPIRTGMTLMLSSSESSAHGCNSDVGQAGHWGKHRKSSSAQLSWVRSDRFDHRQGVALARIRAGREPISTRRSPLHQDDPRRKPRLEFDRDFVPLQARPFARPRIGRGATIPGNTRWRLWRRDVESERDDDLVIETDESDAEGPPMILSETRAVTRAVVQPPPEVTILGLEVDVDTSASGFTNVPCYQAWLEGQLWNPESFDEFGDRRTRGTPAPGTAFWRMAETMILLQMLKMRFGHIHRPTATGFTYRLWFPQMSKWVHSRSLFEYLLLLAHQGAIIVAWVGIQETSEPTFDPARNCRASWKDC